MSKLTDISSNIAGSIFADMSDGVIVISRDGDIVTVNDAAAAILEKEKEELEGRKFAACFFDDERNDPFIQTLLDTVYDRLVHKVSYTTYYAGDRAKQLRIVSSLMRREESNEGVLLVISDITELEQMRDAVKAMETIQTLNRQLEARNLLLKETFGRYLSDEIVAEILDTPDGLKLGGEKKTVTILNSDLRGFSQICERMEPAGLISMVNHYFSEMYEEISRYGGTLIEFLGDGLFVIFGAPVESENHALDAVSAAVGMQRRMAKVNEWNELHGFERLSMGIGINTGEAVVGNIGSEQRTKYGVLGSAVNLAGRIESFSTAGQVLVSPSVRAMTEGKTAVGREFSVIVKGYEQEILISEIKGVLEPVPVFIDEAGDEPCALAQSEPVCFCRMAWKRASGCFHRGRLTALSCSGALLETEEKLDCFEDLLIESGREEGGFAGSLYAKAKDVRALDQGSLARLVFTGKPPGFDDWAAMAGRGK